MYRFKVKLFRQELAHGSHFLSQSIGSDGLSALARISAHGEGYGPLVMIDKVWSMVLKLLLEPKWPAWVLNA